MRFQAAFLFVLLAATCCAAADHELRQQHDQELLNAKANPKQAFAQWMLKHNKGYCNDAKETEQRFAVWQDNLRYAEEYNAKHKSHWIGLNGLADLTHEEYKQKYSLGYRKFVSKSNKLTSFRHGSLDADNLPPQVDWRKTAVAEVKNQQQCGSCWAFSTTGAVEGINAIATGEVVSLSEQELVDCDTKMDHGCSGGLMDYAFEYVVKKGGLHTEDDYPYTASDGMCQRDELLSAGGHRIVTIDGYEDVPPYNEIALKKAVSKQPVSVAIEADQRAFQLYMGGVFDDEECGEQLDHGVLAVGYGVQSPEEAGEGVDTSHRNYWIVKNSWGAQWGDHGYIKIRMGRGKPGLCGIAMQPSYPTKTNPNPPTPPPGPPGPKPPTPPKPQPVQCDPYSECPAQTTCCCLSDIAGFCFSWGCCPMEGATCCADKQHCCPHDLPVCDTDEGRCLPKPGMGYGKSVPWSSKVPATRKDPAAVVSAFFRPSNTKGQQSQDIKAPGTPAAQQAAAGGTGAAAAAGQDPNNGLTPWNYNGGGGGYFVGGGGGGGSYGGGWGAGLGNGLGSEGLGSPATSSRGGGGGGGGGAGGSAGSPRRGGLRQKVLQRDTSNAVALTPLVDEDYCSPQGLDLRVLGDWQALQDCCDAAVVKKIIDSDCPNLSPKPTYDDDLTVPEESDDDLTVPEESDNGIVDRCSKYFSDPDMRSEWLLCCDEVKQENSRDLNCEMNQ